MVYAKSYIATLIVFLGLDFLWLGVLAQNFYSSQLGSLMRDSINFGASAGFYVAYVVGIVFFAIVPALAAASWRKAAGNGALLGLLAYGTYDMTNIATLRDWPVTMSIVDMVWGSLLTSISAVAGFLMTRVLSEGSVSS